MVNRGVAEATWFRLRRAIGGAVDIPLRNALDPVHDGERRRPQSTLQRLSANSIARRMLSVGDPSRGIPPCQACHGPTGQTPVTPSLASQNSEYLLQQLDDFADGTRSNDINLPMRTISAEMSERERQAAAEFYGANLGRGAVGFQSPR
jgi:cytochrome c553